MKKSNSLQFFKVYIPDWPLCISNSANIHVLKYFMYKNKINLFKRTHVLASTGKKKFYFFILKLEKSFFFSHPPSLSHFSSEGKKT